MTSTTIIAAPSTNNTAIATLGTRMNASVAMGSPHKIAETARMTPASDRPESRCAIPAAAIPPTPIAAYRKATPSTPIPNRVVDASAYSTVSMPYSTLVITWVTTSATTNGLDMSA